MPRLKVGFVLFKDFAALDLTGPHEAFAAASAMPGCGGYELVTIGLGAQTVRSESGLIFATQAGPETTGPFDTVIVPGGGGLREKDVQAEVCEWLQAIAPKTRRVATVCTGLYGLAPTGLVDGRNVTTHWRFTADVAKRFPKLKVVDDRLHVCDGKFYTSAGVTAGIDLSLQLIEDDFGPAVALAVARELVVYLRRPGSQQQFSDILKIQYGDGDQSSGLVGWIVAHMHEEVDLARIANYLNLSPRQANRVVSDRFGVPPAKLVEQIRLEHAKTLLLDGSPPLSGVAEAVGFGSIDTFRRAFVRQFGVTPKDYQVYFGGQM